MARRRKSVSGDAHALRCHLGAIMSQPNRNARLGELSGKHETFKKMVWDFRTSHGWTDEKAPPKYYSSIVPSHRRHSVEQEAFKAIRLVSSADGINAIMQRGRMRTPSKSLNKETMRRLSAEMDAVLRWTLK